MAGHNKWSKVKHIKAVVDAKKGRVFSKLAKELTLAAKHGGSSPDTNARLRSAILNARAVNMPSDNIDRAIKKGAGELEGSTLEEITYEGYGQGGVAMLIEVVTDNRNRSVNDLRTIMGKNGGIFADAGSVSYLFTRRGEIRLAKDTLNEDAAMELALECGGEDMVDDGDEWVIYTAVDRLFAVGTTLQNRGAMPKSQHLVYQPATTVTLSDESTVKAFLKLHDALEECDDVQNIHTNLEIADEAAAVLQ